MSLVSGDDLRREHPLARDSMCYRKGYPPMRSTIRFRYVRPDANKERRALAFIARHGEVLPSAFYACNVVASEPVVYWFLADLIDEGKIEAVPSRNPDMGYGIAFRLSAASQ